MLKRLMHLFGAKATAVPMEEAIVPVKTNLGVNPITLHLDGYIEGDFEAIEKYLKTVHVSAYAEDRIIFWLLLQHWRVQREATKSLKELETFELPRNVPEAEVDIVQKPAAKQFQVDDDFVLEKEEFIETVSPPPPPPADIIGERKVPITQGKTIAFQHV